MVDKPHRSKAYQEITPKLPELDRGELELLRERVGALLHLSPADGNIPAPAQGAGPARDDASFLLDCIAQVLGGIGVEFVTVGLLMRSRGIAAFRVKVPGLMAYLQRAAPLRAHQRAIFCIGVELLYNDLSMMGLAISGRSIVDHAHRIPSILNRAFPGYAPAGALARIIIEKGDGRTKDHARPKRSDAPEKRFSRQRLLARR